MGAKPAIDSWARNRTVDDKTQERNVPQKEEEEGDNAEEERCIRLRTTAYVQDEF